MKKMKDLAKKFWNDEDGIGTLEIVLIIAVIVIIFLLFKTWIINFVKTILDGTTTDVKKDLNSPPPSVDQVVKPAAS